MHILYFHQHFSTPSGSTGTRSYEMSRELIRRGHEVTLVCGTYGGGNTGLSGEPVKGIREGMVDGIRVLEICLPYSNHDSLLKRSGIFLRFAWKSIGIAWRTEYDLLFATSTPLTAGIPGIAMRVFKPRKPFVFEVRDLWPELPREMGVVTNPLVLWGMSVLEKLSYRCARACIGLSPGIVEGIRRRCRKDKPVAMIPNGCDLELFRPGGRGQRVEVRACHAGRVGQKSEVSLRLSSGQEGQKSEVRACHAGRVGQGETCPNPPTPQPPNPVMLAELANGGFTHSTTFHAVFTGAHGIANGLDAVLDAAGVLKSRGREDIELVFIGDGKLKPGLMTRAEREGLENCAFRDPVPKRRLAEEIRTFDVGLMILDNVPAFYYGTSPNKFFDYIAAGMPVLNNYPGWLAELIREHDCGIPVPPEAPEAFADALERLADDPEARRRMGANARKLAEAEFDRRTLSGRFANFLERQAAST